MSQDANTSPGCKPSRAQWKLAGAVVVVAIIACVVLWGDIAAARQWAEGLNGTLLFLLMSFLPVVGFPASILYLVAGAKFGGTWGIALASMSIVINLVMTWWIVNGFLRGRVQNFFARGRYKLPDLSEGDHVPVSLLTALLPGVPYAAKNYLLVIGGIHFRTYFWVCLPVHTFRSALAILFGGLAQGASAGKTGFLIAYAVALAVLCRWLVVRLRVRQPAAIMVSPAA